MAEYRVAQSNKVMKQQSKKVDYLLYKKRDKNKENVKNKYLSIGIHLKKKQERNKINLELVKKITPHLTKVCQRKHQA